MGIRSVRPSMEACEISQTSASTIIKELGRMNFWNRALAEFGRTGLPSLRLGRAQVCYYTRRTHDRESRMPSSVVAGSGGKARKVGGRRLPVSNHSRGCAELPSRPTQTLSHHLGFLLHPACTEVRFVCSNSEPRILEYSHGHQESTLR